MRKLIVLLLMVGTFLGGYHLGQRPDSPDIFGWLSGAGVDSAKANTGWPEAVQSRPVAIKVGERTYVIGDKYESDFRRDSRNAEEQESD